MKNKMFSQKGFSLIEVLIVLLIFTVLALAILRAYVSVVHVAGNSSAGAKSDSSVMFGLATADKILQGAGYGVEKPSNIPKSYGTLLNAYKEDNSPIEYTSLSSTFDPQISHLGRILVWKSDTSNCQALIISKYDDPLTKSSIAHTGAGLFYYNYSGLMLM